MRVGVSDTAEELAAGEVTMARVLQAFQDGECTRRSSWRFALC